MRTRKFIARDMSEALAQVKRELGSDAMIVATRPVKRGLLGSGIEVTAAIDGSDEGPTSMSGETPAAQSPGAPASSSSNLSPADLERIESIVAPLRGELRSLRAIVRQNHDTRWSEELRADIAALKRSLTASGAVATADLQSLVRSDLVAPSTAPVVALVGPTGVGKTTTIAKLAARASLVEQRSVALITLDTYRVGGEEQLRTFADLIGVSVDRIDDPRRLGRIVERLRQTGVQQIYIDTAGRSPRDREAIATLGEALQTLKEVEIHLTVAAATSPDQIDATIGHYRGLGVSRLLFTKIDEALHLEELIRTPARASLPITYLGCGQRVPEDLEQPTITQLEELARFGFAPMEVAA